MRPTQVQGLDNEALIELANERREDPLIAELADRLQDALMILDWRDAGGRGVQEAHAAGWTQAAVDTSRVLP